MLSSLEDKEKWWFYYLSIEEISFVFHVAQMCILGVHDGGGGHVS